MHQSQFFFYTIVEPKIVLLHNYIEGEINAIIYSLDKVICLVDFNRTEQEMQRS